MAGRADYLRAGHRRAGRRWRHGGPGGEWRERHGNGALGDLHTKLAVRAQAMNDSVESLRKQMASSGGGTCARMCRHRKRG